MMVDLIPLPHGVRTKFYELVGYFGDAGLKTDNERPGDRGAGAPGQPAKPEAV